MKLIFIGLMYNPYDKESVKNRTKSGFQESADTFQWSFLNGLIKNKYFEDIKIFNVVPTGTYPLNYRDLNTESKKWSYLEFSCSQIGCTNFPILKQLQRYRMLKKQITKELNNHNEDIQIVFYSLYPLFVLLAKYIKKINSKINISVIVPDLPSKFGIMPGNPIKKALANLEGWYVLNRINNFDSFVLLTKHMLEPLEIKHESYVIIEGLFDPLLTKSELVNEYSSVKPILYSGSLNKEFGIYNLVCAFNLIEDESIELWICGSGDCEEFIERSSSLNNRIKYFGQVNRNDLILMQSKAYILVNPRTNDNEYVKYSFPSKTMEYIYSGRPTIMYKLSCLPEEYFEHVYFFEHNDIESIKKGILEVLKENPKELKEFGEYNREWIILNKSAEKQTLKFINLIKNGNQK